MTMNENTIQGKWLEIKGDIQKAWGKLTDDELNKTKGDAKAIAGLIQQKYGEKQELLLQKVSDIMRRFQSKKDEAVKDVKDTLHG